MSAYPGSFHCLQPAIFHSSFFPAAFAPASLMLHVATASLTRSSNCSRSIGVHLKHFLDLSSRPFTVICGQILGGNDNNRYLLITRSAVRARRGEPFTILRLTAPIVRVRCPSRSEHKTDSHRVGGEGLRRGRHLGKSMAHPAVRRGGISQGQGQSIHPPSICVNSLSTSGPEPIINHASTQRFTDPALLL